MLVSISSGRVLMTIDLSLVGEHSRVHHFELVVTRPTVVPIQVVTRVLMLLDQVHTPSPLRQVPWSCEARRSQRPIVSPSLHSASRAPPVFRLELQDGLGAVMGVSWRNGATRDVEAVLLADGYDSAAAHGNGHALLSILLIEVVLVCIKHSFKI